MSFDRIPAGSTVLVTGASGLVGSSVVDYLLKKGFKVRGTGRSAERVAQFKAHLDSLYGEGKFEFAEVADMAAEGAFDAALQGASGVIHIATETSIEALLGDFEKVLESVAAATIGILRSAAKVPSVKSVVLTSSCVSVFKSAYGQDVKPSLSDYDDSVFELLKSVPADSPYRPWVVYRATKVHSDREAFKYWREAKPHYAFNAVLPFTVLGPRANPTPGVYSTHSWANQIFLGDLSGPAVAGFLNPAEYLVDTRDNAAVHVGALLSTETNGERLWAAGHRFTADQMLAVWRKAFPDRTILPDFNFPEHPKIELDRSKSTALVKGLEGRDWIPLEETLIANARQAL